MPDRSLLGPIVLGLALTGATGVALYLLLREEEEWEEDGHLTSRQACLEVRIPKESVALVIGRGGANIREIQAKSETRINFRDELETEEYRVAAIRGSPDGAQMAEILIQQTLAQQPRVETVVMKVPSRTVGRIIGRGGDTVRTISRASRCKVDVERHTKGYETRIELRGSSDSIEAAKRMIEEKVLEFREDEGRKIERNMVRESEERDLRDGGRDQFSLMSGPPVAEEVAIREHSEARVPRVKHEQPLFLSHEEEEEPVSLGEQEDLRPTAMDNCIEVFVSAVSTPGNFWVQKVGPHSVDLDKLTQEMTDYYTQETSRSFHELSTVSEGDIVATRYSDEASYYRARVVTFTEDSYDPANSTVDLDFVDFGDAEEKGISEVFGLKTDFLRLKFQAVACTLAGVRPCSGGEWGEESISQFESLTHAAMWKVLWAKVVGHQGGPGGGLVPLVELIDPSTPGIERNLGEELVKLGLAEVVEVTSPEVEVEKVAEEVKEVVGEMGEEVEKVETRDT